MQVFVTEWGAVWLRALLQVPVVASNRIGTETFEKSDITFYGGSFVSGPTGEIVAQVGGRAGQYGEI